VGFERVEIGGCTLYRGRCEDVLPTLPAGSVDVVITDPPYEGMKGGTVIDHPGVAPRVKVSTTVGRELGDAGGLVHCRHVAAKGAIAFCSYHWIDRCVELLGGKRRCLVSWYKRNSPYSVNNSPWYMTEYAWAVQYAPGVDWRNLRTHIDIPMLAAGCFPTERIKVKGVVAHPTQKPVALMKAMLLPGMGSVCDPYMGTGSTGVACVRMGVRFVGVEVNPEYFRLAVKRVELAVASDRDSLFPAAAPAKAAAPGLFGGDTEG
jgi:site-specific DNA-methyltransferase (adenine-specific)